MTASFVHMAHGDEGVLNPQKRNSLQLCDIINQYTGRNCLSYAAYGCFCGLRSWGSNPVDGSDSCCRQHDRCFNNTGCKNLMFTTYSYRCSGSSCQCTDSDTYSCKYRSCQCDVELAQCLRGVRSSYDSNYFWHKKTNCK
ncbi:hypothetical protein Btru_046081 [Bulinus truncatus]|nr:hypothetical protein Btru_046081 [Bulinus truncatus]